MKKRFWLIAIAALAAVLVVAVCINRRGRVKEISLAADQAEKADFVRLRDADGDFWLELRRAPDGRWSAQSSEGAFMPDAGRIEDFLHVLNLWQPEEISAMEVSGTAGAEPVQSMQLKVKQRHKKLLKLETFIRGEDFFVCVNRREAYKMGCSWQRSSWKDFFHPSTAVWQNRLLVDLNYFEIESVRVGDGTYRVTPENEARFSVFKQVYFDWPSSTPVRPYTGALQQELVITARNGQVFYFQIFLKTDDAGRPDPFKAVVVKGSLPSDTVEVPWVVLDKMTGVGSGF